MVEEGFGLAVLTSVCVMIEIIQRSLCFPSFVLYTIQSLSSCDERVFGMLLKVFKRLFLSQI